ncbi:MAG TPA: hypothetical protein VFT16_04165 [Candidatus Saccharimonadales bacterium]|nr:hypothetical protein [Candidatus Saccharimonadales bacterium]
MPFESAPQSNQPAIPEVLEILTACDAGSCPQVARVALSGEVIFGLVDVDENGEVNGPVIPVGDDVALMGLAERIQAVL